jgi:hypothetical protein
MFRPTYLDRGQVRLYYRKALESAEAAVLQAYLRSLQSADGEGRAEAEIEQAVAAVKRIEADYRDTLDAIDRAEAAAYEERRQHAALRRAGRR